MCVCARCIYGFLNSILNKSADARNYPKKMYVYTIFIARKRFFFVPINTKYSKTISILSENIYIYFFAFARNVAVCVRFSTFSFNFYFGDAGKKDNTIYFTWFVQAACIEQFG